MQQVLWVDPVAQDRADGDAFGRGKAIPIPEGWVGRAADHGQGIVYQRPGAVGNADTIRLMEPTPTVPSGLRAILQQPWTAVRSFWATW